MPDDIFKSREQAFEAVYFAKLDSELIEKSRQKRESAEARSDLAKASGISNEALLDSILELGITPSNLEAMSLAPLICVAWANGTLDPEERKACLDAAHAEGIEKDSASYMLFDGWLSEAPDPTLLDTWREFITILMGQLDALAREQIRKDLFRRSESIARAAGGVMGIGSISKKERAVLDQIEAAIS
jgi:hypothetical protein